MLQAPIQSATADVPPPATLRIDHSYRRFIYATFEETWVVGDMHAHPSRERDFIPLNRFFDASQGSDTPPPPPAPHVAADTWFDELDARYWGNKPYGMK